MGLSYSAHLAFPRARTAEALRDLARHAVPIGESRVALPGGESLALPFLHKFREADIALVQDRWTLFAAIFWMPLDGAGRDVLANSDRPGAEEKEGGALRSRDGREEVRVGYVYVTVGVGTRFTLVTLSPATSGMSRLFEASEAVRGWLWGFAERSGGVLALLDLEGSYFPRLDGRGALVLDEDALRATTTPDGWVELALAAPIQHG